MGLNAAPHSWWMLVNHDTGVCPGWAKVLDTWCHILCWSFHFIRGQDTRIRSPASRESLINRYRETLDSCFAAFPGSCYSTLQSFWCWYASSGKGRPLSTMSPSFLLLPFSSSNPTILMSYSIPIYICQAWSQPVSKLLGTPAALKGELFPCSFAYHLPLHMEVAARRGKVFCFF